MSERSEQQTYSTHKSIFLRLNAAQPAPRELAWEEFRRRYAPIIAGFARNMGARSQDRDDVVQDVMLGFYAKSPTFVYDPSRGRFRGYLKVCTFRALRQRLGRDARFDSIPLQELRPESAKVDAVWSDVWDQERLRRALDEIREEYAGRKTFRAFELYVMLDGKPEEVAEELGISSDSVYKAKERITVALRKKLLQIAAEED